MCRLLFAVRRLGGAHIYFLWVRELKKIIDSNIFGLLPVDGGFLYIKPEIMPDGRTRADFIGYEVATERTMPVTKWTYFEAKFGPAYKEICPQLKDYVNCETGILANNHTVLIYPNGDVGIFNARGVGIWTGTLTYNDSPVRGIAADGKNFWSVVPELNAIICYATEEKRVQMRIGGGKSTAFIEPVSIIRYNDKLFICNKGSNKVRTISLSNYAVSDYLEFDEPVHKYFIAGGQEFVKLDSGLYQL